MTFLEIYHSFSTTPMRSKVNIPPTRSRMENLTKNPQMTARINPNRLQGLVDQILRAHPRKAPVKVALHRHRLQRAQILRVVASQNLLQTNHHRDILSLNY